MIAGLAHPQLHALRDLLTGIARGTAELVAQEYDGGAEIWAEREQIARQIVSDTISEAAETPDAPLNHVVAALVESVPTSDEARDRLRELGSRFSETAVTAERPMSDSPERIWLQRTEAEDYRNGWTWCWHRIDDDPDLPDVEYVHVDTVRALTAERDEAVSIAREALEKGRAEVDALRREVMEWKHTARSQRTGFDGAMEQVAALRAQLQEAREALERIYPAAEGFTEHWDTLVELGLLVEVEPTPEFVDQWGPGTKCWSWKWRAGAQK